MTKEKVKKKSKILLIVIIIIFLIACTLIAFGMYLNRLANGNYIINQTIDKVDNIITNYLYTAGYELGDNYTLNSDIDIKVDSEFYKKDSLINIESKKKYNYIKNLNNFKSKLTLTEDNKNNKLYFELSQKLGIEELVNVKYLIDDATEYYYVSNFLPTYVNNGNCNYFESTNRENSTRDNILYLHDFIIESLKNNIQKTYIENYENVKVNINTKQETVNQTSLKLDNATIQNIVSGILDDLKEDEKANKILTSIDENFSKRTIKDDTIFLKNKEYYTINIYTSKTFYKPLKLEIIHMNKNDKKVYLYEGNENEGTAYYLENDNLKYNITALFKSKKYEFIIKDESEKELGLLKIDFDKNRTNINYTYDDSIKKLDINYISKYSEDKITTNDKKLTFKISENKIEKLNGDIHVASTIKKEATIPEKPTNAVLKSTVSKEAKENLKNKQKRVKDRLER